MRIPKHTHRHLALGMLLALVLLSGMLAIARLENMSREFASLMVERLERVEALSQLTDAQQWSMRAVARALVAEDRARVAHEVTLIGETRNVLVERLEHLDGAFATDDEREQALLRQARERSVAFLADLARFTGLVSAGDRAGAKQLFHLMEAQLEEAYGAITIVTRAHVARMLSSHREAQRANGHARIFVMALCLGAIVFAIAVAASAWRGAKRERPPEGGLPRTSSLVPALLTTEER